MEPKEEIKNKLDIVEYIGQFVQLKRAGRNFRGLCPFHGEKTPSFFVSPDRQSYKCFGCGLGGDIFQFYMEHEGVTFPEALKDLAQKSGVELKDFRAPDDFLFKQKLLEINNLAAKFYHYLLVEHKLGAEALAYLKKRDVNSSQIKQFNLGYAPNGWQALTDYLVVKKKYRAEDVEKTGLILKGSHGYYDRFRGRIMFPLYDVRDNLVGFSGRILPQFDDGKSGKYINSPETSLYHKSQMLFALNISKDNIRKNNQIIVVEGELDVLASYRASVKQVVAVKGSALTEDQVKLIKRYTETIILALDADEAGIEAAKRAILVAQSFEMNIKVIRLLEGKDPDELVRNDPSKWRELVKTPVDIYQFFLDSILFKTNPKTLEGKQSISKQYLPILIQIENKVVQDHYLHKLSRLLNIETPVLVSEMERLEKKIKLNRNFEKADDIKVINRSRLELLMEELLALILQNYQKINLQQLDFTYLPNLALTKILLKLNQEKPKDLLNFAKNLAPELQSQFDCAYLKEIESLTSDKIEFKAKILISEIAKIVLRDKLSSLRQQLSLTPKEKKPDIEHQINLVLNSLRAYN